MVQFLKYKAETCSYVYHISDSNKSYWFLWFHISCFPFAISDSFRMYSGFPEK